MIRIVFFALVLTCMLQPALRAQTFQSDRTATALIELYTSEGCSSCPPADRWLGTLKDDLGLWHKFVPVSFHVTYWDYLGWKDPFAKDAFSQRQRAYAAAWNARNVYTPAFVNQGREWHPNKPSPALTPPGMLTIERETDGSGQVRFIPQKPSPHKTYTATVVVLGGGVLIDVKAGENAGRALPHEFVALHLSTVELTDPQDGMFTGVFQAPPANLPATPRRALAVWVSADSDPTPLQATGGWLN
jgi:hypothetical protein